MSVSPQKLSLISVKFGM